MWPAASTSGLARVLVALLASLMPGCAGSQRGDVNWESEPMHHAWLADGVSLVLKNHHRNDRLALPLRSLWLRRDGEPDREIRGVDDINGVLQVRSSADALAVSDLLHQVESVDGVAAGRLVRPAADGQASGSGLYSRQDAVRWGLTDAQITDGTGGFRVERVLARTGRQGGPALIVVTEQVDENGTFATLAERVIESGDAVSHYMPMTL